MRSPCNICLEETCGGKHDCNCKTCKLRNECYRFLHATVRITNRYTQKCEHCCFSSHPDSNIMMTVEMSEKIATFVKKNDIRLLNLMGGEFFCNPDWFEIFSNLVGATRKARIVTNGDWVKSPKVKEKLLAFIEKYGKKVNFSISKDRWHTNENVEAAGEFFKDAGAKYNIATEEETTEHSIVPVGRSALGGGTYYSMFSCYCHSPKEMYSFLIDENGDIYKCSFGILQYANVEEYLDGGFDERFKEFNKVFYKCFISSCRSCSNFAFFHTKKDGKRCVVPTE